MPIYLEDGSLTSSNLGFSAVRRGDRKDCFISKARVDEVLYVDDVRNSTYGTNNPQVQYVCTVLSGSDSGKRIFNVIAATFLGGAFNCSELIHQPMVGDDFSGREEKSPAKTRGEIVLIVKLNGSPQAAVIIGSLRHPLSKTSTTKADGQRFYWEYNGFTFSIDNEGALTATFGGGPKNSDGQPADEDAAGSKIVFSKNGGIELVDKNGNGVTIDAENKKVELVGGTGGVDINSGGNWNIQVSGNASIQADGNVEIDGTMVALGGGGVGVARIGSVVMGTDGEGRPITAWVDTGGSSLKVTSAG